MRYSMMGKRGQILEFNSKEDCVSKMRENGWLVRTISYYNKNDEYINEKITIRNGIAKFSKVKS